MEHPEAETAGLKTPGLKWRARKSGRRVPYWCAPSGAKGYPVRAVNLSNCAADPRLLAARCQRLQAEYLAWRSGRLPRRPAFDGSFGALIDFYTGDQDSPYRKLKPSSRHPYDIYARKLKAAIGERRIDACDGRDVRRWFDEVWSAPREPGGRRRIPAARMALTVLKSAISFGIVARLDGCVAFRAILDELEFPLPDSRTEAPIAAEVAAVREAARAAGRPSAALAYALQFETALRQWDVIGQWVPLSDPRPSALIDAGRKWIGPTWAAIDSALVLRLTPGKTEDLSGARVAHDLRLCPMVMQEIESIPPERRTGPLIVDEKTGLPYRYEKFRRLWRVDARAAGVADRVWNRDLRAGGITEGHSAGARLEDRSKAAGHTSQRTTANIYSRDQLESARRVMRKRTAKRSNDAGTD